MTATQRVDRSGPPGISVVIPAWNEAELLPRLLDSVEVAQARFAGARERIEVIVADNGSTDATARIAVDRGCRVEPVTRRCIAAARNGGAAVAREEVLAFCDADFRIAPETFNFIADVMTRPGIVGGATGLTMERWSPGIWLTWHAVLPPLWAFGLDGGVWFCRRADFRTLGGYDERVRIGEDVRFLLALKQLGARRTPRERLVSRFRARRLGLTPPLAVNSTRKWDEHGDWHVLRDAARLLPQLLVRPRAGREYIDRYWYGARRR